MSFLDDIIDFGGSLIGGVIDFVRSDSIPSQLAKAALAGRGPGRAWALAGGCQVANTR